MEKIRFACDYSEGAAPEILSRLMETNLEQTPGYGEDVYCEAARMKIRALCAKEDAEVQFLVGGTQTNTTVIASILRPHQGVIAADTGHINVHETGAIEATGHKVLPLPSENGKIRAEQIWQAWHAHWTNESHEHLVQPGMVYISFPTEYGTLYTKEELTAIYRVCRECHLPLFIDGARLGYGLMSPKNDVTLQDLAALCDVFYIGGTKCGALFGEAVVITDPQLARDFRYMIKQRGGMLAKGRLLGIQFNTLFTDDLYWKLAKQANRLALRIRKAFLEKGYPLLMDSWTNQQFPVLPDEVADRLSEQFAFEVWERIDETHCAVRFCTSWATTEAQVDALVAAIQGEKE